MDGRIGDGFVGRRKALPATHDEAVNNFPRLILGLRRNSIQIFVRGAIGEARTVTLQDGRRVDVLLESDFLICREIAASLPHHLFPGCSQEALESKIVSLVSSRFAGRGVPISR